MNNFAIHSTPPDELDELLSAHLDGELDAAAADLGYDAGMVRAAIESSPEAQARLVVLRRTVNALQAEGTLEIDELSRRRLVKATLGHVPAQPSASRVSWIGAAAGIVAVAAFAGAIFLNNRDEHDSAKMAREASSTTTEAGESATAGALRPSDVLDPKTTATTMPGVSGNGVADAALNDLEDLGNIADANDLGVRLSREEATLNRAPGLPYFSTFNKTCAPNLGAAASHAYVRYVARGEYRGTAVLVAQGVVDGRTRRWLIRVDNCAILLTVDL